MSPVGCFWTKNSPDHGGKAMVAGFQMGEYNNNKQVLVRLIGDTRVGVTVERDVISKLLVALKYLHRVPHGGWFTCPVSFVWWNYAPKFEIMVQNVKLWSVTRRQEISPLGQQADQASHGGIHSLFYHGSGWNLVEAKNVRNLELWSKT